MIYNNLGLKLPLVLNVLETRQWNRIFFVLMLLVKFATQTGGLDIIDRPFERSFPVSIRFFIDRIFIA